MRLPSFRTFCSPFWRVSLFLTVLPAVELYVMLYFFPPVFVMLSMILGGMLGIFLARREGAACWIELNQQVDRGESPVRPALNGMLLLFGILFLTLPGLISGLFGLFLLFPLTRAFVVSYLILRFESYRLHSRRKKKTDSSDSPEIIDIA